MKGTGTNGEGVTRDDEAELHILGGAYALDAVLPAERARFEGHLGRCPACASEVTELLETAARLGQAVAETPPPAMREAVLRRIGSVRQEPPPGAAEPEVPARRGGTRRRAVAFALAACVTAAALGGTAVWQWQTAQDARARAEQVEARAAELSRVMSAPDARVTTGPLPGGGSATVVVSASADRAAFAVSGLAAPPPGKVYQLWFDEDGRMRPAGLLDPAADGETVLMDGALGGASGMGVTLEPDGGSPQPTSDPLAVMAFPTA
ncbi:anti-sigma factor [Streptomyces avicenniae]|uniref:anti-sigma factor n=1 Tax=Streptomyces avicenniae TaxID=500153 RepID=UPI000699893A|nr:anti-sigma factor [Streptomyces avicenniae]